MVLAERNAELVRNGRRSRGPSPNGHSAGTTVLGTAGNVGGTVGGSNSTLSVMGGAGTCVGGGGTPDTSSDDDNSIKRNGKSKKQSEYEEKIRVGRDYQAVCPPLIPENERKPEVLNDRALLVWSPTKEIPDNKLEEYISVAKEKYGYNGEQALGMLFWHKHDLERAVVDLANFTPFPDEWTVEDKVLFEQAFQFHGKSFHRIRQMLPDKSIASLVKYYYSWKKTRHRQSTMDRQEKAKASKEGSENGSENGSNEDSDNDDKEQVGNLQEQNKNVDLHNLTGKVPITQGNSNNNNDSITGADLEGAGDTGLNMPIQIDSTIISNGGGVCTGACGGTTGATCPGCESGCCSNCGVACNVLLASPHGKMCESCHHHWRRTGETRPTKCPYKRLRGDRSNDRHKRKPRGIHMNHDDIVALAQHEYDYQTKLITNIDRDIISCLSQIQANKAILASQKKKINEGIEDLRPMEPINRINARWTNEECMLAVQGMRKFGKDFQIIAELIGNKTEAHVRTFFVNHRRRYNLDQVLKKYEAEKEAAAAAEAAAVPTASPEGKNELNTSNDLLAINKEEPMEEKTSAKKKENLAEEQEKNLKINYDNNKTQTLYTSNNRISLISIDSVPSNSSQKESLIVEIDLDAEQPESPASKKIALTVNNQNYPEASAV